MIMGKPEGMRLRGTPRRRWEVNVKIERLDGVVWIGLI
jgi:hypothetical protein